MCAAHLTFIVYHVRHVKLLEFDVSLAHCELKLSIKCVEISLLTTFLFTRLSGKLRWVMLCCYTLTIVQDNDLKNLVGPALMCIQL